MKFIVDSFIYVPDTFDLVKNKDIPEHYEIRLLQPMGSTVTTIKIPVIDESSWLPFKISIDRRKEIDIHIKDFTEVYHLPLYSSLN